MICWKSEQLLLTLKYPLKVCIWCINVEFVYTTLLLATLIQIKLFYYTKITSRGNK